MKKLLIFSIIAALVAVFQSCGFDDAEDVYPETSVLFPYQDYNRNIIVGEGLKLNVGIIFSGVTDNRQDRHIQYIIDPSLVTEAGKSVLPTSYYTCGHLSQIIVPAGQLKGYLTVTMDSLAFLSDPKSLTGEYVLPVRMISSGDVDIIQPDLDHMRIALSYYAKQHGYYNYSGKITKSKNGNTREYAYSNISTETNSIRFLSTAGPIGFCMIADQTNSKDPAKKDAFSFLLNVPVEGGQVTIYPDPVSPVEVHPEGNSTYDAETKTFYLSYTYALQDSVCTVSETLVFRNRIRDVQDNGLYINEWR